MPAYIIAVMLCAALLHATWNAIVKSGSNKLYESAINCFGGGLTVLFLLPFLPLPAAESLPFLMGSCLTHIFYYLSLTIAYRNVDMSYAYTLMRGTAPLLTSLFLPETRACFSVWCDDLSSLDISQIETLEVSIYAEDYDSMEEVFGTDPLQIPCNYFATNEN